MAHLALDPTPRQRLLLSIASELSRDGGEVTTEALARELVRRGLTAEDVDEDLQGLQAAGWLESAAAVRDGDGGLGLAADGREALRRLAEAGQLNVRLPHETRDALRALLPVSGGTSLSALAAEALREWTRTERFPGVDFRWSPSGRQPYATGTGLTVWEIHHVWSDHGRDVTRVLEAHPQLTEAQVQRAVAYAEAHLYEIPVDAFGVRPAFAPEIEV